VGRLQPAADFTPACRRFRIARGRRAEARRRLKSAPQAGIKNPHSRLILIPRSLAPYPCQIGMSESSLSSLEPLALRHLDILGAFLTVSVPSPAAVATRNLLAAAELIGNIFREAGVTCPIGIRQRS
jgi:hypothetical protein